MNRTGAQQRLWRFRRLVLLLVFVALGTSQYPTSLQDVQPPFTGARRVYSANDSSSSVVFAGAAAVLKTIKRIVNQGWRNGGRYICKVLGCEYDYVKSQLYNNPAAFVSFKALCIQIDKLEVEIGNQNGGEPTATQKELRYILLSKAAKLIQQHLGLHFDIPADYLPPSMEMRAAYQHPTAGRRHPVQQGGQASFDPGAAEGGAGPPPRSEEEMRQSLNSLPDAVQLPTAEEFDRHARQRLAELQKQHAMQSVKLKTMSRQKLQLLTEAHEQEAARLYNELQQTQTAELAAVRGDLEKQRHVFVQALESFSLTGKLLAQSKLHMQKLYEAVQRMAAQFSRLIVVESKLAQLQKALQQEKPLAFQYSCVHAVTQSDLAVAHVMGQVLAAYDDSTAVVDQVLKLLGEAETAVESPAIEAAQLSAQKQVFKDRLNQFRAAAYNLIARMEETVQTAEERKLVTLFISEDVRNKVFTTVRERVGQWKEQLTRVQARTDDVELSHKQFLEHSSALARRVLAAVNGVLQSPSEDSLASVSGDITELEKLGNKIREELSGILEALPVLEHDIRTMAESLRAAGVSASTMEELGIPALLSALQSEHDLKERAQRMFVAIRTDLGRTESTLRVIHALQKETSLLRSPADREALDSEIRDIMAKLRDISHSKAEVEVDLQHLHVDIQQLQNSIRQINQRLSLERNSAHLAGDIRGWIGKGDNQDTADEKAAAAVTALEQELKTMTENLAAKQKELAGKHSRKVALTSDAKQLEGDMQARQRVVAEEQARITRVTQLSQVLMENLHAEEGARTEAHARPLAP